MCFVAFFFREVRGAVQRKRAASGAGGVQQAETRACSKHGVAAGAGATAGVGGEGEATMNVENPLYSHQPGRVASGAKDGVVAHADMSRFHQSADLGHVQNDQRADE